MSEPLPARQETCDSYWAAKRSQIASPCRWFVPGCGARSCLPTLMPQCGQKGLSHFSSPAPLGTSDPSLSPHMDLAWETPEWIRSSHFFSWKLTWENVHGMSVPVWVAAQPCSAGEKCRSRMAPVAGDPQLNILEVLVGKMLAPSWTWAEMWASCKRGAEGAGKEQSRGISGKTAKEVGWSWTFCGQWGPVKG